MDNLLATLKQEGVRVAPKREASRFGRFAWLMDQEGNKIELWEPSGKRSMKARR